MKGGHQMMAPLCRFGNGANALFSNLWSLSQTWYQGRKPAPGECVLL